MTFDISVKHDLKKLQRDISALEHKVYPKTVVRTLNRVADSTKVSSAKHIASQINSTQSGVKRRIRRISATRRKLWATLVARGKEIPLIEFVIGSKKLTQQKGGKIGLVKTKIAGKKETHRNAFITYKKRGQNKKTIYERISKKQYPLQMKFGPGIAELFAKEDNGQVMKAKIKERFAKEFASNLKFYVSRMKKR